MKRESGKTHSPLGCSVDKYFSVQPLEVKWSSEPNRVLQEICSMHTFTKCGPYLQVSGEVSPRGNARHRGKKHGKHRDEILLLALRLPVIAESVFHEQFGWGKKSLRKIR